MSGFGSHNDEGEPGAMLREARLALGLDIQKAAADMHVGAVFLEAMEENRFEAFDAPVYAKGFLRKYATMLGLDPGIVISCYESRSGGPREPTLIPVTPAAPKTRARWLARLRWPSRRAMVLLLGFIVLLGGGYWYSGYRTEHARDVSTVARAVDVAEPTVAAPLVPADVPAQPAIAAHTVAAIPVTSDPTGPPPAAVLPTAVDPAADTITILGIKDAWVEVRASDGSRLFYDHVRAGELRSVRGQGPWGVYLSDTAAVEVRLGAHVVDVPASKRTGSEARFGLKSNGTIL